MATQDMMSNKKIIIAGHRFGTILSKHYIVCCCIFFHTSIFFLAFNIIYNVYNTYFLFYFTLLHRYNRHLVTVANRFNYYSLIVTHSGRPTCPMMIHRYPRCFNNTAINSSRYYYHP